MKTININIFRVDELTAEAYDLAYKKYVENYSYWENAGAEAAHCFKDVARAFGVEIRDWSMSVYSGVEADWLIDADAEEVEGVRAWIYIQNNFLNNAKGKYFWKHLGKYRRSRIPDPDWLEGCPFTGYFYDCAVSKAWKEFTDDTRAGRKVKVKDFFDMINNNFGRMIEEEYESDVSEEAFRDYCDDECLWFCKNGEVFGEESVVGCMG